MDKNIKLNNKEIMEILLQNYNIKSTSITEINRGTADIFKIETKNKKYVLKEFLEGRTKESVIKEFNIINFLNEKQIKIPIYVKSKTDNFYIEHRNKVIVLQEFIEGYTMENNTGDYEKTIESAMLLGKITKALENYEGLTEEGIIEKSFSKKSIQNGIAKIKDLQKKINKGNPYKEEFIDDLEFKIKVSEKLEKEFDFEIINKMTIINSHGDFSVQQLIYNDKEETTIIDFETAKKMPIVWEVMRSYSYVDKEAKDGELNLDTLVEYFKEFSKYIKLNEYDLKYAPHLYLIQVIANLFGYKQINENYEKKTLLEFTLFRTKLCRYLYEHLEKISSRLINDIK